MDRIITSFPAGDPTLAARYLADQLDEHERATFEQRMLEDPAVLREVEATARFKAGLQQAQATGKLELLLAPRASRTPYLAFAAMLALVAVGISVWRSQDSTRLPWIGASIQQLAQVRGASLPAGREYTLIRLRAGDAADLTIDLPVAHEAIKLRILPDVSEAHSRHRVTLVPARDAAAQPQQIASLELEADERGYLSLFIDSASVRAGLYRLNVAPAAGPREGAEDFLIRIQRGEQP